MTPECDRTGQAREEGEITLWMLLWVIVLVFLGSFSFELWNGLSVRRSLVGQAEAAAAAGASGIDTEHFRLTGEVLVEEGLVYQLVEESLLSQSDATLVDAAVVEIDPVSQEVRVEVQATVEFTLIKILLAADDYQISVASIADPRTENP